MSRNASLGGISAASGFRYQYLKTIEALLDLLERNEPTLEVTTEDPEYDAVDYSIYDASGRLLLASQVKSAMRPSSSSILRATDALRILLRLASTGSVKVTLQTNRALHETALALADDLVGCQNGIDLGERIRNAPYFNKSIADALTEADEDSLEALSRASIEQDRRATQEIVESIRDRVAGARRQSGLGVGTQSSSILVDHLIAKVFELSANDPKYSHSLTLESFRELLALPEMTLAQSVGAYDWRVPIGYLPPRPSVARPDLRETIAEAISIPGTERKPSRCVLVGLSGIGKSSSAAEFAHEYGSNYDWIAWVDCESSIAIRRSIVAIVSTADRSRHYDAVEGMADDALAEACVTNTEGGSFM